MFLTNQMNNNNYLFSLVISISVIKSAIVLELEKSFRFLVEELVKLFL